MHRLEYRLAGIILLFVLAALVTPLEAQTAAAAAAKGPWSFTASYGVRQSVDGNVYLQDTGPTAKTVAPVTFGSVGLSAVYQRTAAFRAAFSYAPEGMVFWGHSSENHATHRAAVNLGGVSGSTAWELTNALIRIDGSDQGPIFDVDSACDIPALGGIPMRDRRDALIYRNGARLTQTFGHWFLRPTFSTYFHDFYTEQRARTGAYRGYENYVDRWEVNGGADVGYRIAERTHFVVGHRIGHQKQGRLLGAESPYTNTYNRVLAGIEGAPLSWLRLNLMAGPDMRNFKGRPAGFDPDEMLYFVNASVSVLAGKKDAITVTHTRHQQPAFSSHSVYEDIIYDFAWRRQVSKNLLVSAGFRAYGGDWQAPVCREDWIYTPTASVSYAFHKRLAVEATFSHDSATTNVPDTKGREFTRPMFAFGIRGTL